MGARCWAAVLLHAYNTLYFAMNFPAIAFHSHEKFVLRLPMNMYMMIWFYGSCRVVAPKMKLQNKPHQHTRWGTPDHHPASLWHILIKCSEQWGLKSRSSSVRNYMSEAVIQFLYFLSRMLATNKEFSQKTKLFTSQQQPMMNFPEMGKIKMWLRVEKQNFVHILVSTSCFMLHVMWWCDAISQRPTRKLGICATVDDAVATELHCHSSVEHFEHLWASFSIFFLPCLDGGGRKFFHFWIKLNEEDY